MMKIQDLLERLKNEVSASSCTFYIRDPIWKHGFRLAAMVGVEHPEPMYGFSFPPTARDVISLGPRVHFSRDAQNDQLLREKSPAIPKLPPAKKVLFGDFVTRERVKSCARLIYPNDDSPEDAVLFVNFRTTTEFNKPLRQKIEQAFQQLVSGLSALRAESTTSDAPALAKLAQLLSPGNTISGESMQGISGGLESYLRGVLTSAVAAFGGSRHTFGTLHLYDSETQLLNLIADVGQIQHVERAKQQLVKQAQGVITWVVLRRRALLIRDLASSAFSNIHLWLDNRVKCEMAAPMVINGRVIGAICLESRKKDGFSPGDVRVLWYAANRAAVACQYYRLISLSQRLLEGLAQTTSDISPGVVLDELATITKEYLDADLCDIWKYSGPLGRLGTAEPAGASYRDFKPSIREDGWTYFVWSHQRPVWICKISANAFKVLVREGNTWRAPLEPLAWPKSINPVPVDQGVRCELGLPIISYNKCTAVAWIKYKTDRDEPTAEFMNWARGFGAEVAVILDAIGNRSELTRRQDTERAIQSKIGRPWEISSHLRIDGYCCSNLREIEIGGDYCRAVSISKHRVGILLLDGEGHGLRGSLNMLPLAGAFDVLQETASVSFVMDKLNAVARNMGLRATGRYCLFTQIADRLFVSSACAGHPAFLLLRAEVGAINVSALPELRSGARGGSLWEMNPAPVTEEVVELSTDDLLIGFTDGVSDPLGYTGIASIGERGIDQGWSPKEIAELIIKRVAEVTTVEDERDDATVFVVRVKNK
jgi:GAF domain-containing protein